MIYKLSKSSCIIPQRLLGLQAHSKCGLLLLWNKTYNKTKQYPWAQQYIKLLVIDQSGKLWYLSRTPIVCLHNVNIHDINHVLCQEKTSCVCADILVDWNSCLCWTLWIQNSQWVLSHFMWTVISLLKSNFLIIENLPYIAGIAANKWVEFSISSLSLLLVWWTTQHSATAFTVLIDFIFLQYQQCWTIKHLSPFLRFSPDEILQKILITTI